MEELRTIPCQMSASTGSSTLGILGFGVLRYQAVLAFNAESITTRRCRVHVDIVHIGTGENFLDDSFHFAVCDVFLSQKASAASVALDRARAVTKFIGEPDILRVTFARLGVNKHGARQGGSDSTPAKRSYVNRTLRSTPDVINRRQCRQGAGSAPNSL